MKVVTLILLVWGQLAFSYDESHMVECDHDHSTIEKLLEWFSSDDKRIMNAPCKSKTLPTEEEMLDFIAAKDQEAGEDREIHGVKFSKEKKVILDAYRDLVTAKDSYGISDNKEKQRKLQSEFKINPECQKVLCALEKVWGRDYAIKMLYIKLKHGYNISEIAFNNASRFHSEELEDVLLGLEDIPSHLIPLARNNQQLIHFQRGKTLAMYSGKTLANAVVMIFDYWDKESRPKRQYTIFHEMAHNMGSRLDQLDRSPEWLDMSGWIKKGDLWEKSENGCFVSEYGRANPWEDFAESVSSYRYNGETFKAQCPEKYEFIKKKVFKDIEYLNTESCSPIAKEKAERIGESMALELKKEEARVSYTEEEITKSCQGMFSKNPPPEKELSQCAVKIQSEHFSFLLEKNLKSKMREEGVPYTSANRTLLQESIYRAIQDDEEIKDKASKGLPSLKENIQKMAEQSFKDALPKGFTSKDFKPDDYKWDMALKVCGKFFFSGEPDKGVECELMELIKRDEKFQEWDSGLFPGYKVPGIFSEASQKEIKDQRNKALIEHLRSQELSKKAMIRLAEKMRKDSYYHSIDRNLHAYSLKDWDSMSPQKFCKETYGKASKFMDTYGYTEGEEIPLLYRKCVEAQSKRKERFIFTEAEWKSLMTSFR
jgi:hypothetical protein